MHLQPRSLAYRTDLMLLRHGGSRIEERQDCLAIHTPENPTFHWGNFLVFRQPPAPGDLSRWEARFAEEFRDEPEVQHRTFGWDAPDGASGDLDPFLQAGYKLEDSVVLSSSRLRLPPRHNEQVIVRPLETDADWEAATQIQIRCNSGDYEPVGYELFVRLHMAAYRRMVEAGLGAWFGAFLEGRQVGNLGLYVEGGVGRFQTVGTDPEARRQGVCRSLVHAAAAAGLERMGAEVLVIVADRHAPVARIYESAGFEPTERQMGLSWWKH